MQIDLVVNPTDLDGPSAVEAARVAEAAGFDGVWTYDHLSAVVLDGATILEPWTLLGAMAAATSSVTVGPLVANATVRHPAYLAAAAATLHEVSEGRAMLGLGAGAGPGSSYARELSMVGAPRHPAAERRAMVIEAVNVIRRVWSGTSDYDGAHFRLDGATGIIGSAQPPPIIVGANGPKMSALAGQVADGVNIHWFEPDLEGLVATARSSAAERPFVVTVESPITDEWIDPSGPFRAKLTALEVDRFLVAWRGEYGMAAIQRAARMLGR